MYSIQDQLNVINTFTSDNGIKIAHYQIENGVVFAFEDSEADKVYYFTIYTICTQLEN